MALEMLLILTLGSAVWIWLEQCISIDVQMWRDVGLVCTIVHE
jgi:hypothetical protein